MTERSGSPPGETAGALTGAAQARRMKELPRFDGVERVVHWSTALLMLVLLFTGSVLYIPTLALMVGHRAILENIHVVAGIALLVPLLAGVLGPWRGRLVEDLRRFDSWVAADFDWFRRPAKRLNLLRGKFSGGQKMEAAFLGGSMVVMLVTGVIMRFAPARFVALATGATLVHDIGYIALFVAVGAHILFALSQPDQLKSMFTGRIGRVWAARHAPVWLEEMEASGPAGTGADLEPSRSTVSRED